MLVILGQGGLAPAGVNFDAKVRRESFEPIDLFHAHIGGMDAFARGLKIAAKIRADGVLVELRQESLSQLRLGDRPGDRAGEGDVRQSLEKYMLEKGNRWPPTRAAGKKCSKTSSTSICDRSVVRRRLVAWRR